MSALLVALNEIKARADPSWCTPAQARAYEELSRRLRRPDCLNLCGPAGAGKTFVAWFLCRHTECLYCASPADLQPVVNRPGGVRKVVVVDSCPHDVRPVREVLMELQLLGCSRAVLVSREPVDLAAVHRVVLPQPTGADLQVITRNWAGLVGVPWIRPRWQATPEHHDETLVMANLWELLRLGLAASDGEASRL